MILCPERAGNFFGMISDLSRTLRAILKQPGLPPELSKAEVVFTRPTGDYKPSRTEVDLFLFDIRENVDLRLTEPVVMRRDGQAVIRRPPVRVACSYLVTAWPVGGSDLDLQEHRLLSQVLQLLFRYPTIPAPLLRGSLAGQEPPPPLVASHTEGVRNTAEFWSALGIKPRASLTIMATLSMPVLEDVSAPLVTTRVTSYDTGRGVVEEQLLQIGGRVLGPGNQGLPDAVVELADIGLRTRTDAEGRFTFTRVPAGTHSVRVAAVGYALKTQSLIVPGRPEDYEVVLTAL